MPHTQCNKAAPFSRWTQLLLRPCCRRYVPEMHSSIVILLALCVSLIGPAYASMITYDSEELSISEARDRGIHIDIGPEPTVKNIKVTLSSDFTCYLTKASFRVVTGTRSSQIVSGEIRTKSRFFEFELYKTYLDKFQLILECSSPDELKIEKIYWIDFGK